MNITDLPTEVTKLPSEVVAIVTDIVTKREDSAVMPVNTVDLPEPVIEEVIRLLEKYERTFRLPQLIRNLPPDVTSVDVAEAVVALNGWR